MEEQKRKSLVDLLTSAYIHRVKRWMFCPSCKDGKMTIDKKSTMWTCEECGYQLSADEFENDYVFWFCDECQTYLNTQEGFDRRSSRHICTQCGFENDTTFDNLKGICADCGKTIPDPDGSLCADCLIQRRNMAKDRLNIAGKVVGTATAIAGAVAMSNKFE